jgi:hypothetical protein
MTTILTWFYTCFTETTRMCIIIFALKEAATFHYYYYNYLF